MPISTLLLPNTIYRVKAMVKTVDGSFQIGLSGTDPAVITSINTNNEWKAIDFTFTTGATLSTPGMYFNNYTCTGKTAFIDNWELYVAKNPIIKTSTTSYVADNNLGKTFKFTSLAANLKDDITITAPAGITVSPATISKDSITQQTITATYDGTTAIDGNIVLTSDTVVVKVAVISDNNSSSACFTPLYMDRTNIVPDPYMNNTTTGWGTHELILAKDYPDSVYCGLSCGRISGSGDFDIALTGKIKPNTSYVAKAMVMTFGEFQMGVFGVDSVNTSDIVDSINTNGIWQPMTFNFTTGVGFATGGTQGLYFNNWQLAGTRAFIDNWELYEAGPSAVQKVSALTSTVYVSDGKIVAKFELADASLVKFDVYDIRGELIATDQMQGIAGSNYRVLKATLQSGVYLVKMTQNGQSSITKLVK